MTKTFQNPNATDPPWDPVFLHARRELLFICGLFLICLLWSVGVCRMWGYPDQPSSDVTIVLGMPAWVFGGIVLPWLFADLATIYFCFRFMRDDDLGHAEDEQPQAPPSGGGKDGR